MKRKLDQQYIWTDIGDSVFDTYKEWVGVASLDKALVLIEISDRYSTYDYATDIRVLKSTMLQELLK